MYSALWNLLPGPRWSRVVTLVLAAAAIIIVLFQWVFPWVSSILPYQETTVS